MYRRFLALFVSVAFTLAGVQPGTAAMIGHAMNVPVSADAANTDATEMRMSDMGMTQDMPMNMMDHSCCPDESGHAPNDGNCGDDSWLACAIHCGVTAPAFLFAPDLAMALPHSHGSRLAGEFQDLISTGSAPPFRPPRLFIRA